VFFDKLYEMLGDVPPHLTADLAQWCRGVDPDRAIRRTETVFATHDSRLVEVMDKFEPRYEPAYDLAKPLMAWLQEHLPHLAPARVVPYRFELSFVRPRSRVLEHYDTFAFHRLCDRIHVPLVTDGSTFTGRWFPQPAPTRYTLPAGCYARLNNRVPHEAINDTDHVRVHAIVDFMDAGLARDAQGRYIEYRVPDMYAEDAPELAFQP
jgi:hypothetical protein